MPARRQTMEEWERQRLAWARMPKPTPRVLRGYEHTPVDEGKVKREAEEARELMKEMTCLN